MKGLMVFATIGSMFISMPISLYLTHSLLINAHADRLLMFLFWINIPISMFFTIIFKIVEESKKK